MGGQCLLIAHQNLAESVEPRVGHLDYPSARPLSLRQLLSLLSPRAYVRNISVVPHGFPGLLAVVPRVSAEVLPLSPAWLSDPRRKHSLHLRHVVAVGPCHDYRQRESMLFHQRMPFGSFFSPCRSDSGQRPPWRAAPCPGFRQCFANSTQSPPFHHIRQDPSSRA